MLRQERYSPQGVKQKAHSIVIQVYERWMQWQPSDNAWLQYIKFELRCHEVERARAIYERLLWGILLCGTSYDRYVSQIQTVMSFTRLAKFEERHGNNVVAI